MGIFYQQVELVNRTSKQLEIMYDGQRLYLLPNYTAAGERIPGVVNMVPKQVVPNALNQTVVMGSEKAKDPGNFESKLGLAPKPDQRKFCKAVQRAGGLAFAAWSIDDVANTLRLEGLA